MTRRERERAAYELVKRIATGKFWTVDAPLLQQARGIVKGKRGGTTK